MIAARRPVAPQSRGAGIRADRPCQSPGEMGGMKNATVRLGRVASLQGIACDYEQMYST